MEFILQNIGEGIETISISDINIKENQKVNSGDSIMIVETDKASIDIPIEENCIIKKIHVKIGDLISPGQKILDYELIDIEKTKIPSGNDNNKKDKDIIKEPSNEISESKVKAIKDEETSEETINIIIPTSSHASPSTKKLAREMSIDIDKITGTGKNNRITKEDVLNFAKGTNSFNNSSKKPNISLADTLSKWGLVEEIQLNNIQKTSSKRLHDSWNTIPHVTQFDEIDITELDKLLLKLKKINAKKETKPSYLPFFIKVASNILEELTIFNSSFNTDSIIQKHYYNIGFAVNTPKGLLVPVIKGVNEKSIKDLTIEFNHLVNKARNNKLSLDDMSGGCLTISSLGNIGGKFFTPIINPPEVAILGISSHTIKPIFNNNKFIARKMLPISLSYDHRVVNGADAATFTKLFGNILSNPSKL